MIGSVLTSKYEPDELPILNQRLKLYGYETLGQLVRDFLMSKFPPITEDRQIQAMDNNIHSNGLNTVINGPFEPTFYKNIDLEDMLNYLLTIRKYQKHNLQISCKLLSSVPRYILWS